MKFFIKSHPKTGIIEKISPVFFDGGEEIDLSEDHPFLQELISGNFLPVTWKNNNGEIAKVSVKLNEKNYDYPKINLKPMIELKTKIDDVFVWQTPWLMGTFFITDKHNRWKILKIFEIGESCNGTFKTQIFDFQLFSLSNNDEIYEQKFKNTIRKKI